MKLKYNSPVILTFTLLSTAVLLLNEYVGLNMNAFFSAKGIFSGRLSDFVGMIFHIFAHAGWEHLIGNFSLILLVGPILEEKYGTKNLLMMIFFTALITGILQIIFFDSNLIGASGIVFMLILLASITNHRDGGIPITFILIVVLYLGKEIINSFDTTDNISQFGHIIGGICGAIFGFVINKENQTETPRKTIKNNIDPVISASRKETELPYNNLKKEDESF